jgi:hypothetical protein
LSGHCLSCDSPAGICVRHVQKGEFLYEWYGDPEKLDGVLIFEKWGDGSLGTAVVTGMLRSEFIKATTPHLVGIDSKDFGLSRKIDTDGAYVILEEMYQDAQTRPRLAITTEEK